jgi:hypothetical protein
VHNPAHSTAIVIVTMILSAAYAPRVAVAAARQANAQPKAAPAGAGDACSYLTKQDAAAALGEAVTGPRATNVRDATGAASACEYEGSGLHRVHLNVMPLAPDMASMYKALCAQKGKEGLTGLGDVTCWYNDKHEELQVLKGNTFFSIELRKSGDPTEAIKGVARKVFAQLK